MWYREVKDESSFDKLLSRSEEAEVRLNDNAFFVLNDDSNFPGVSWQSFALFWFCISNYYLCSYCLKTLGKYNMEQQYDTLIFVV